MNPQNKKQEIDWFLTLTPLVITIVLALVLFLFPSASGNVIEILRSILVGELGAFYLVFGLAVFLISLWVAFSRYGRIKLGTLEKPRYKGLTWGILIFTSTMAADILYWSLIEWAYYFGANPFGIEDLSLAQRQDFASAYPLFHWGPIAWSFYILPAAAYGYMMFVKKRTRQRLSEACRPVIGKHADGVLGKAIDIFSIIGLLGGTATTFSLTTPLLSNVISNLFGIPQGIGLMIFILVIIAVIYTTAVTIGMKGISKLATICVGTFVVLLAVFLILGPTKFIVESGVTGIGKMVNDFFSMATWMDPLRVSGEGGSGFPQDWTVFYWAYWITWFVATPFFIGKVSEGRTIKETIVGGYSFGLLGTFSSFIIFGNFGLFHQTHGNVDAAGMLASGATPDAVILEIFNQLPIPMIGLAILAIAMIAFYASTFDALTYVVAEYSLKKLEIGKEPPKFLKVFWSLIFIILPIALLFNESTLTMLQTVAIITAFPLAIIMGIIIYSFIKDLRTHH
ncbi:BCCT family transporter [Bacillus sp. JJ1566]|uniref:BCCT family transporter n=1 Tax=Bacillus sp. JJ1566 TaxID=3122961 RepID=UPI002FFE4194